MPTIELDADVAVIGGGIVGLATARALLEAEPTLAVVVVEKEADVARHQTGHNSGVLHAGVYYPPGSAKARLCVEGRQELEAYCAGSGIPVVRRGKVVVATSPTQLGRLDRLREQAQANGVACTVIDRHRLAEIEPHVAGSAALHVPATAVVDFGAVARALAGDLRRAGASICTGFTVERVERLADGRQRLVAPAGSVRTRVIVNCAGLHSDRVARLAGVDGDVAIVPFRGEYRSLRADRAPLVRTLVYPVPDPRFPFLGVHATRDVDEHVHLGPNAVLALRREGYRWREVSGADLMELARSPQLRGLARRWWRTGIGEVVRSLSSRRFLVEARRLLPELELDDLEPNGAGVRAQAVDARGSLLDDFSFAETEAAVHVLNAPSPAATASLAIGRTVAARALARIR